MSAVLMAEMIQTAWFSSCCTRTPNGLPRRSVLIDKILLMLSINIDKVYWPHTINIFSLLKNHQCHIKRMLAIKEKTISRPIYCQYYKYFSFHPTIPTIFSVLPKSRYSRLDAASPYIGSYFASAVDVQ